MLTSHKDMYQTVNKIAALNRKWSSQQANNQRNLMNLRLITVLFVLVCSIIGVANCDHKGSVYPKSDPSDTTTVAGGLLSVPTSQRKMRNDDKKPIKQDPLSLLREIYLDYNNKILTLVSLEPMGESVQKFHPNGRYGRSSVNNPDLVSHFQFGKLSANRVSDQQLNEEEEILRDLVSNLLRDSSAKSQPTIKRFGAQLQLAKGIKDAGASPVDFRTEMSKILKCYYTGLSNLYRCDN